MDKSWVEISRNIAYKRREKEKSEEYYWEAVKATNIGEVRSWEEKKRQRAVVCFDCNTEKKQKIEVEKSGIESRQLCISLDESALINAADWC